MVIADPILDDAEAITVRAGRRVFCLNIALTPRRAPTMTNQEHETEDGKAAALYAAASGGLLLSSSSVNKGDREHPIVKTEQNDSIQVDNLSGVVVVGIPFRQAAWRLVPPPKARDDASCANNRLRL